MKKELLKGMGTALVTPFKPDESIDYEALESLVEHQIASDADFLVVLGTTAETPALDEDEQDSIIRTVVETAAGRIPIVVGCSSNGTKTVIECIERMPTEGVTAILTVCPYYNKPSQEGLYQHFRTIADRSPLPILLYNVPARTAVNMLPETTLRLARNCPNIIGIKEASGIVSQIDKIVTLRDPNFIVLSGDDTITYPLMTLGADGVVSVIGNVFPKEFSYMVHCLSKCDLEHALPYHRMFKELFRLLFIDGNPVGVKCAMAYAGMLQEKLRLPLVPMSDANRKLMHDAMAKVINEIETIK